MSQPSTAPEPPPATPAKPESGGLSRAAWHFLVDVALLIAALAMVGASAILQFAFPLATQADGWSLWGWGYDRWSDVRFLGLCVFLVVALVHVMLQWNWVCGFVTSRLSRIRGERIVVPPAVRTLYGVATLIAVLTLLGALLTAATFMVQPPP